MGSTHMAGGALTWLSLSAAAHYPPKEAAFGAVLATVGALVPDIDTRGSRISRDLPVVSWVVRHLPGGTHRHLTHSLAGMALFAFGTWAGWSWLNHRYGVPGWAALALVAGYAAHIAMDMLTVEGCPLLWPRLKPAWYLMVIPVLRCHTGLQPKKRKGQFFRHRTGEWWFWRPATYLATAVTAWLVVTGR